MLPDGYKLHFHFEGYALDVYVASYLGLGRNEAIATQEAMLPPVVDGAGDGVGDGLRYRRNSGLAWSLPSLGLPPAVVACCALDVVFSRLSAVLLPLTSKPPSLFLRTGDQRELYQPVLPVRVRGGD